MTMKPSHPSVPIHEVRLKILAVHQQLKMDVRQHIRVNQGVTSNFVIRNSFQGHSWTESQDRN